MYQNTLNYISKKVSHIFHQYEIIDNHIHIGKGEGVWFYPDVDAARVMDVLENIGISKAIVFPNYHKKYLDANEEIFHIQQSFKNLVGFGRLNTGRASWIPWKSILSPPRQFLSAGLTNFLIRKNKIDTQAEIVKCINRYKLKGFKISPGVDGQLSKDEIALINEFDVPILIHDSPQNIYNRILRFFPKTKIILPHMGGYPANSDDYLKAIKMAGEYENLYLDTSATMFQYILHKGITEIPDKLIFGSDLPAWHPAAGVTLLMTLDIPETHLRRVFSENIKKLVDFS
ncbi:MAG: amidohydrolase family protein [Candidatus Marinimicrobia bacterium]|nr:amidohydrolase family protein [Candidatus Neomarinimicrobiota bacterium]